MKPNLETLLLESDEWHGSRKVRLGNKWLITFWCGALISESDITTAYARTPPAQAAGIIEKWNQWCVAEREPLVRGTFMVAVDGVSTIRLQQFLLPDGQSIYLRREILKFLPEEELSYCCIVVGEYATERVTYFMGECHCVYGLVRAVLVENANEVIAIFAEMVPHAPIQEETH